MPSITKNANYTRRVYPLSEFGSIAGKEVLAGVYKIFSPRGCYIGSTINIPRRLRTHNFVLRRGTHHSPMLQSAYDKYGELRVEILFSASPLVCTRESLLRREQTFLDSTCPRYNCSLEAKSPASDPRVGYKISRANKGRIVSEETRRKISAAKMGHTTSQSARKKMREAKLGVALTEDHKKSLSDSLRGRKVSRATREKMSRSRIGIKFSLETRKRIADAKRGIKTGRRNLDTRLHMLVSILGVSEKFLANQIRRIRRSLDIRSARETSEVLGIPYKRVLRVSRDHETYCYLEGKYRG